MLNDLEEYWRKQIKEEKKAAEWKWKGWNLNTDGDNVPIDVDFEQILVHAMRYALEKKTGITLFTTDYISRLVPKLSNTTLTIMNQDFEKQKDFGMDYDKHQWKKLWIEIKKEMEKRNETENNGCHN